MLFLIFEGAPRAPKGEGRGPSRAKGKGSPGHHKGAQQGPGPVQSLRERFFQGPRGGPRPGGPMSAQIKRAHHGSD